MAPCLLRSLLKKQPAHKPLMHHDENMIFLSFGKFCYHGNQLAMKICIYFSLVNRYRYSKL